MPQCFNLERVFARQFGKPFGPRRIPVRLQQAKAFF